MQRHYSTDSILKAYLETCVTSLTELFAKIGNDLKPFNVFLKSFVINIWQGPNRS